MSSSSRRLPVRSRSDRPPPACVVADVAEPAAQLDQPVPPDRTVPVVLHVGQPRRRLHERASGADLGDREVDSVGCLAEPDRLAQVVVARVGHQRGGSVGRVSTATGATNWKPRPWTVRITRCARPSSASGRTRCRDPARQRAVGDEVIAPDGVEDLGPGAHPLPMLDQEADHLEHLRLDRDPLAAGRGARTCRS